MHRLTRLNTFFNKPLGIWLLSSAVLGVFGLSYDMYRSEKELTMQRLSLISEIQHRLGYIELKSGVPNISCTEATEMYQNDGLISEELRTQLFSFVKSLFNNQNKTYLFSRYSAESTNALIIEYEINLNRSIAKRFLERKEMPVEKLHKGLAFDYYLVNSGDMGESDEIDSKMYLISYKEITNYFQYAYAEYYLNGYFEESELDCSEKMLGNI